MKKIIYLIILLPLLACSPKKGESPLVDSDDSSKETTSSLNDILASIETGVTSISGVADDASNETLQAKTNFYDNTMGLILADAWASNTCDRSLVHQGSGVCVRNVNCQFGVYAWSGNAQLTFNNASSCTFSGVNDYFIREINFTRSGPRGSLRTTSDSRSNYEGGNIGGGIKVTKTISGFSMDILGQSKILTSRRFGTIFDISLETSSALELNKLERNGRILSSGSLVVYHNKAGFKVVHDYNNVQWSSSCCYPTSGTVNLTISGSRTNSGSVTFNGCGQVTTSFSEIKSFELANCE